MIPDTTVSELTGHIEGLRAAVDEALDRWLPSEATCPRMLAEAMRYSVFPGGKRLRPVLVQLACEACGGDPKDALPAACAVELVHSYSLVHDDLPAMDDDDLRRGRPTTHKQFGEAIAILAGDGLLTLAFEVLAEHGPPDQRAGSSVRELAWAAGAFGMVGGQADDCSPAATRQTDLTERLPSIHARKTGALFRASARLGAIAAGATDQQLMRLEGYGQRIGLMFQITDDLLDVGGDESKTGKRLGKDGHKGKLTYPAVFGIESSRQLVSQLVREACERIDPLGAQADRLRQLVWIIKERDR